MDPRLNIALGGGMLPEDMDMMDGELDMFVDTYINQVRGFAMRQQGFMLQGSPFSPRAPNLLRTRNRLSLRRRFRRRSPSQVS